MQNDTAKTKRSNIATKSRVHIPNKDIEAHFTLRNALLDHLLELEYLVR